MLDALGLPKYEEEPRGLLLLRSLESLSSQDWYMQKLAQHIHIMDLGKCPPHCCATRFREQKLIAYPTKRDHLNAIAFRRTIHRPAAILDYTAGGAGTCDG
jgi:hypothetical protein